MKLLSTSFVTSVLIGIVLLAGLLRFYAISQMPVSLYWDETAIAYNAYSIAQTGHDEYGNFLPLLFRSFDDYKLPGNVYLSAIVIKLFGLNEFSARASSAFLGTLTVLVTFFLTKTLFSLETITNKRIRFLHNNQEVLGLLAAGLMAISPWHIQFSRTGFEANGGLFFVVLGMYLLLRGLEQKKYFYLSFFVLGVSLYFYRSIVLFVPLLLFCLLIILRKEIWYGRIKQTLLGISIFLLTISPIVTALMSPQGQVRFQQVTIAQTIDAKMMKNAQMIQKNGNTMFARLIYNRRLLILEEVAKNYFSHFSPQFLLLSGDINGRHHVEGMGQLYLWEGIFVLIGLLVTLFFLPVKIRFILLAWLLLSPLAASIANPAPHALRSLNMLPIPQMLTSVGVLYILSYFTGKQKIVYNGVLSVIVGAFFIQYLYLYYVVTPKVTAVDWGDGYKQLTAYIIPRENNYDKIIVTGHYWQPYIYFLFYKHYDPATFQKSGSSIAFGKYYFGGTSWDLDRGREELDNTDLHSLSDKKKTLVALSPSEFQQQKEHLTHIKEITDSFGKTIFLVGELL